MSKRIKVITEALDCNETKARIVSEVIKDIPDAKLLDFFVFRMKYLEPYKSADVATKEALFDYQRIVKKAQAKKANIFAYPEAVKEHCQTYYRGKDIVNGPASYFDFVVIGMNKDGELVNKYRINDHGSYSRLSGDDEAEVYQWLFENQNRIGDVHIVLEREVKLTMEHIEAPDHVENTKIGRNVAGLIGKAAGVVRS